MDSAYRPVPTALARLAPAASALATCALALALAAPPAATAVPRATPPPAVPAAPAATDASPEAVVASLYRAYAWELVERTEGLGGPSFLDTPAAALEAWFTPALAGALAADRACVERTRELCRIDASPLWGSQDPGADALAIRPGAAEGEVEVRIAHPGGGAVALRFVLLRRADGAWRIADILDAAGGRGLAAQLGLAAGARARAAGKPAPPDAASPAPPPGEPRSLANAVLARDAMTGVSSRVAMEGCVTITGVTPYVTAEPTGTPGARRWSERWMVACGSPVFAVDIHFQEDGLDAARYDIPGPRGGAPLAPPPPPPAPPKR